MDQMADDNNRAWELSTEQTDILDFERTWWKHAGVKEQAIRERFDMSATRYYQLLNELLEKPAAMEHDPILVKRLKRLRTYRQRQRVARLLGAEYSPGRRSDVAPWGGTPLPTRVPTTVRSLPGSFLGCSSPPSR